MADKTWQNGEILPADDFNRWEQNIASLNTGFTVKEFTDENVLGTAEWNRLEQGIFDMANWGGNRNSALNSTVEKTATGTNARAGYNLSEYGKSVLKNQTVSISFECKSSVAGIMVDAYVRGSSASCGTIPDQQETTEEWKRFKFVMETDSTDPVTVCVRNKTAYSDRYVMTRNMKCEIGSTATDWSPAPEDIGFEPNTIEDDTLIDADEANHIEQGIEDMINYAETYKDTSEADATPQSIPDDTEDSDEVAAPEAEEIE